MENKKFGGLLFFTSFILISTFTLIILTRQFSFTPRIHFAETVLTAIATPPQFTFTRTQGEVTNNLTISALPAVVQKVCISRMSVERIASRCRSPSA